MMNCPNCGSENQDNVSFCSTCGANMNANDGGGPPQGQSTHYSQAQYAAPYPQQAYAAPFHPGNFEPLTTWGFMWTLIVSAIPFVGFIVLLVWAFSDGINRNRRNYARASLLLLIIVLVVMFFLVSVFGLVGALLSGAGNV